MKAYEFSIEEPRDSPIFTTPCFKVEHIIATREDGHQAYEAADRVG